MVSWRLANTPEWRCKKQRISSELIYLLQAKQQNTGSLKVSLFPVQEISASLPFATSGTLLTMTKTGRKLSENLWALPSIALTTIHTRTSLRLWNGFSNGAAQDLLVLEPTYHSIRTISSNLSPIPQSTWLTTLWWIIFKVTLSALK